MNSRWPRPPFISFLRIKWIHRDLRQEPAEAQKASFGLGVALVCRVVCPPGVYAYPGFASIICFGVVRPCGASELIVPIKVLYATLWLIRTNGVNACTYGAHPGNANWVFSAPIRNGLKSRREDLVHLVCRQLPLL